MYDNGTSGMLATTGIGITILGTNIGLTALVSVGLVLILIGAALIAASARTRRTRRPRR